MELRFPFSFATLPTDGRSIATNCETADEAMPRVRKQPEERREELLDAAWELFTEQGWDATTVQDVIERVGIAKGTFYHYFSTQEDLLDAVLNRIANQNLAAALKNVQSPDLDAVQRLNRFFAQSVQWRVKHIAMIKQVIKVVYRPENRVVRQRLWTKSSSLAMPIISEILRQGVDEGNMVVEDHDMSAEMLIQISFLMGEANAETLLGDLSPDEKLAAMTRRYTAYTNAMAKMIGLREGEIQLPGKLLFKAAIESEA